MGATKAHIVPSTSDNQQLYQENHCYKTCVCFNIIIGCGKNQQECRLNFSYFIVISCRNVRCYFKHYVHTFQKLIHVDVLNETT